MICQAGTSYSVANIQTFRNLLRFATTPANGLSNATYANYARQQVDRIGQLALSVTIAKFTRNRNNVFKRQQIMSTEENNIPFLSPGIPIFRKDKEIKVKLEMGTYAKFQQIQNWFYENGGMNHFPSNSDTVAILIENFHEEITSGPDPATSPEGNSSQTGE